MGTVTGLQGDSILNFGGNDVIDITDLAPGTLKPIGFNASTGLLTLADKTHGLSLQISGGLGLANFTATSDGQSGTLLRLAGH